MRRMIFTLGLGLVMAAPALAQEKAAAASKFPAGWQMRLDNAKADPAKVRFEEMGAKDELHAWTGPAAIFWQPKPLSGNYRFSATFTQMKAPTHPEAYGIFIGGKNLDKDDVDYGYFVIRGDGKYMIKHRAGSEVHTIVDWTEHKAVTKQDAAGKATNALAFEVSDGFVKALINGHEVQRLPTSEFSPDGMAGVRINHNLDVHITKPTATKLEMKK